jgi:Tfp pilus assembly protein PilN
MRRSSRSRAGTRLLCCLLGALSLAAPAGAATPVYEKESEQIWEQQLAARQIRSATINKFLQTVRTRLKDGRYVIFKYPKHQEPRVRAQLAAKHVHEANKKPRHHKLRYIVGGVALGLIVLAGAVLLVRRWRMQAD